MKQQMKYFAAPLHKAAVSRTDDGALLVLGAFTSDNKDMLGDIITRAATEKAIPAYKQWGNIRYMHLPRPVGKVVRIGESDGLSWNEVEFKVFEEEAAKQVEQGLLSALSVGILIDLDKVDFLDGGGLLINEYLLSEISLVDHPANYDAALASSKLLTLEEVRMNKQGTLINTQDKALEEQVPAEVIDTEVSAVTEEVVEEVEKAVDAEVEEVQEPVVEEQEEEEVVAEAEAEEVTDEAPVEEEVVVDEVIEEAIPVSEEEEEVVEEVAEEAVISEEDAKSIDTEDAPVIEEVETAQEEQTEVEALRGVVADLAKQVTALSDALGKFKSLVPEEPASEEQEAPEIAEEAKAVTTDSQPEEDSEKVANRLPSEAEKQAALDAKAKVEAEAQALEESTSYSKPDNIKGALTNYFNTRH